MRAPGEPIRTPAQRRADRRDAYYKTLLDALMEREWRRYVESESKPGETEGQFCQRKYEESCSSAGLMRLLRGEYHAPDPAVVERVAEQVDRAYAWLVDGLEKVQPRAPRQRSYLDAIYKQGYLSGPMIRIDPR